MAPLAQGRAVSKRRADSLHAFASVPMTAPGFSKTFQIGQSLTIGLTIPMVRTRMGAPIWVGMLISGGLFLLHRCCRAGFTGLFEPLALQTNNQQGG